MQRWEYRVISLRDGAYTQALNEYGVEGWELVSVVPDPGGPAEEPRRRLPMPRAIEKLEDAASRLEQRTEAPTTTSLLWVLRRPLDDELED